MSSFKLYIGPFADWLVPQDERARQTLLRAHEVYTESFGRGEWWLDYDPNPPIVYDPNPPTGRVGSRLVIEQHCWTVELGNPRAVDFPPAIPRRRFTWSDDPPSIGVFEYPGFDGDRERCWFVQTVADQLNRLADVYRTEARIKWGVVTKLLDR
jgi:hypothetical protein